MTLPDQTLFLTRSLWREGRSRVRERTYRFRVPFGGAEIEPDLCRTRDRRVDAKREKNC